MDEIDNECKIYESVENIIYNNVNLSERFTDKEKGTYLIVNSVYGRGLRITENSPIEIPFLDGQIITHSKTLARLLTVKITLKGVDFTDLRRKIDDLNDVLVTDRDVEIRFADEPGLTYFGRFNGYVSEFEVSHATQIEFEIVCSDPFKYREEKTEEVSNTTLVNNEGNDYAAPIIELTATKPVTYAMVENGQGEYNLVGFPLEEEGQEQVVDEKVSIMREDGSTLGQWSSTLYRVDEHLNDVTGSMSYDGTGIRAESYGTGNKMHGPAVTRELPSALQDFEIQTHFDIISNREEHNFRMEVYFMDENLNMLGKIGVKDNSRVFKRRYALGRVGQYRGSGKANGYAIGDHNYSRDINATNTLFYLWVRREGNLYTFWVGRWRNHKYEWQRRATYRDVNGDYNGRLKYITLFIGSYKDRSRPSRMRINSVEVFELNQLSEDQTPYIAYDGDTVLFDHENEEILINGEDAMPLKVFGGDFWRLSEGYNNVVISPPDAFTGAIKFREKIK